jgi:hypothetical protein
MCWVEGVGFGGLKGFFCWDKKTEQKGKAFLNALRDSRVELECSSVQAFKHSSVQAFKCLTDGVFNCSTHRQKNMVPTAADLAQETGRLSTIPQVFANEESTRTSRQTTNK